MMISRPLIIFLAMVFLGVTSAVFGQFPFPPGGGFQGGPPMGPGGQGGFMGRGPGDMGGGGQWAGRSGRRGGGRRGDRGNRGDRGAFVEGFLRRMDINGDGIVQESEVPEQGRGMLRMMSSRYGFDSSQGISIDKVRQAVGSRGGPGGMNPPVPGSQNTQNRSNQKTKPEEPPLVPGFGLESEPTPVAGFGVRIRPAGRVILGIEGDVEPRIRELFGRLDRNGNGLLDRNEWAGLPGNPNQFDANQDGRITLAEVAAHMNKIQKDRNQNTWGNMGQGGFGPGGWMPGNFGPGGFGADGWGGMNGFGDNHQNDKDKEDSTSKTAKTDHRSSYRFRSALERMPKGLPDWFVGRDEDFDGQVSMAEFADDWTQPTLNEYLKYDRNRDGVITPDECLSPGSGGGTTSTSAPRPRQSRTSRSSSGGGSSNPWWRPN